MIKKIDVTIDCAMCSESVTVAVDPIAYQEWKGGKSIQKAFDYLTASEREMLKSRTCQKCWDSLFGDDYDA